MAWYKVTLREGYMVMNMGTISYWFFEAFESMRKNFKNVLISISTMLATMLIIAIGYAVLKNSEFIGDQKQQASSKILAYLNPDVTTEQISRIRSTLEDMNGVVKVEYITPEEAIDSMPKKDMFTKGIEEEDLHEIFQPFFRITFNTVEAEKEIISTLRTLEGVGTKADDVQVSESAKSAIQKAESAKWIARTAIILLVEVSVFLMINNTKLMLYARRKEISIMKYVGAKDGFIKMPFAIEGIFMSLIAVGIVLLIFTFSYDSVIQIIGERASFKYLSLSEFMPSLRVMLIVIACLIGAIGSTASMNKYLDV